MKCKPKIVEMTGIFGAGYLPGLLKELTTFLKTNYSYVDNENKLADLIANYHVDNEAAKSSNLQKRERVTRLLKNVHHLDTHEWNELLEALKWADKLFQNNIKRYPSHIAFRRGGRLQNYILLRGNKWEEAEMNRLQPKIQIFLEAEMDAIRQTFEQNIEVRKLIQQSPDTYSQSPEIAYERQEEWKRVIETFPGVKVVTRVMPGSEKDSSAELVKLVTKPVIGLLKEYGLTIVPKRKIFISYSHQDVEFANKLEAAIMEEGINVWIDKKEILVGDSLINKIRQGLDASQYVCAIVSKNSINSPWVQEEWDVAMNQQISGKAVKLLPLIIEPGLTLPSFLIGKLYINFAHLNFGEGVEQLMNRLKAQA